MWFDLITGNVKELTPNVNVHKNNGWVRFHDTNTTFGFLLTEDILDSLITLSKSVEKLLEQEEDFGTFECNSFVVDMNDGDLLLSINGTQNYFSITFASKNFPKMVEYLIG